MLVPDSFCLERALQPPARERVTPSNAVCIIRGIYVSSKWEDEEGNEGKAKCQCRRHPECHGCRSYILGGNDLPVNVRYVAKQYLYLCLHYVS
jgi:hypothetical protein